MLDFARPVVSYLGTGLRGLREARPLEVVNAGCGSILQFPWVALQMTDLFGWFV